MTTPNIEKLIEKLRTSLGDLECPNTYEFTMHQAANSLQSQAERIKELETEATWIEGQLSQLHDDYMELKKERDTLRAQLAEIEKTEPVAWTYDEAKYHENDLRGRQWMPKISRHLPAVPWMQRNVVPLFTRPMPAQDVTELVEALEHIQRCVGFATATIHQGSATWCQSEDAIESLRTALAQQASEEYKRGFSDGLKEAPTGECWIRAIDEAMVGAHLGIADMGDDYGTAKKKLNDLICWSVDVDRELAQQDDKVTALRSQVEYLEKIVEDQAKVLEQAEARVREMFKCNDSSDKYYMERIISLNDLIHILKGSV